MHRKDKRLFIEPDCTVELFDIQDIITTSSGDDIEKPGKDNWDTDEF